MRTRGIKTASKFRVVYGGSFLSIMSWQVFLAGVRERDVSVIPRESRRGKFLSWMGRASCEIVAERD